MFDAVLDPSVTEQAGSGECQLRTGGRSERIRTYNFEDTRVTDHRIGLTIKRLDSVFEGNLDDFVDALASAEQAEKLAAGNPTPRVGVALS